MDLLTASSLNLSQADINNAFYIAASETLTGNEIPGEQVLLDASSLFSTSDA